MSNTAYIAFGGNMGDTRTVICEAVDALNLVPGITVLAVSSMLETKPWGYESQDNFINACARLDVTVSPQALLGVCLGIEAAMGRHRSIKNGPRIIDIDVIMYDDEEINTKELILPHPRMWERDFVLVPLLQVIEDDKKSIIENAIKKLENKYIV